MKKVRLFLLLALILCSLLSCGAPKGTVGTVGYYLQLDLSDYLRLEESDYRDLSVTVSRDYLITESDVDRRIDSTLLQYATVVNVENVEEYGLLDHIIGIGDSISIYYYATDENGAYVPLFSNCFAPSAFRVGNSGFIPGFDEKIAELSTYIWETHFYTADSGKVKGDDFVFATYKATYPTASGLGTHTAMEGFYERIDVSLGGTLANSLIDRPLGVEYTYEKIEDINGDGQTELVTYTVTPHFISDEQMRSFTLTVPAGYCESVGIEDTSYDGKELTFHLAVDSYHIMPTLDRHFLFQKLGYFGTVASYRQKVLSDLLLEEGHFSEITTAAFEQILKRVELKKYPKGAVDSYVWRLKGNIESNHRYFTVAYAYTDVLVKESVDAFFSDTFGYLWKYNSLSEYLSDFPDKTETDYEKQLSEYNNARAYYRNFYDKQFESDNGFAWKYQDDIKGFAKDIFKVDIGSGESLDAALRRHAEKMILQDLLFFSLAEEFNISFSQEEIARGYDKYVTSIASQMKMTPEECIAYYNESYDEGYLSDRALYNLYNEAIAKRLFSYITVNYE